MHIQIGKTKKVQIFFCFSLVHHWHVGFDIAAFNLSGQMIFCMFTVLPPLQNWCVYVGKYFSIKEHMQNKIMESKNRVGSKGALRSSSPNALQ